MRSRGWPLWRERLISKLMSVSAQNSSVVSPVTMARPRSMSVVVRTKFFAVRPMTSPGLALASSLVAD